MPRDWPDPRFPDKPVPTLLTVVAALLAAFGTVSMVWGAIETLRRAIG